MKYKIMCICSVIQIAWLYAPESVQKQSEQKNDQLKQKDIEIDYLRSIITSMMYNIIKK